MPVTRVQSGSTNLLVEETGQGSGLPIVFAHSLGGTRAHWDAFVPELESERRVIRYDIRGHGESTVPEDGDFKIETYASDIGVIADQLGLNRFFLIGHSMSGGAAYAYAADHSERVAGLLALDAIMDCRANPPDALSFADQLHTDKYDDMITHFWGAIVGPNEPVRERLFRDIRATKQKTIADSVRELMKFDALQHANKYTGESFAVVLPTNDNEHSLHRLGRGFDRVVVVDGAGHWIQLDKPHEFKGLLREFIENIETD